ncbi:hypothetical protein C8Q79DRAFT_927760 [Trametes meyenii]|nr:hypothetical protein C8Q79DRAFT_927760 [Trametes meyenii]
MPAGNEENEGRGRRVRKPTEKGQLYTQSRSVVSQKPQKAKPAPQVVDASSKRTNNAKKPASASLRNLPSSKLVPAAAEVHALSTSNDVVSAHVNTIDFSAHVHSIPRPRSSITPAKKVSGERQPHASVPVNHSATDEYLSGPDSAGDVELTGDSSPRMWSSNVNEDGHKSSSAHIEPELHEYHISRMPDPLGLGKHTSTTIPGENWHPLMQRVLALVSPLSFERDQYSDDDDDSIIVDHCSRPRARAISIAYQDVRNENTSNEEDTPDADNQTVYDNDYEEEDNISTGHRCSPSELSYIEEGGAQGQSRHTYDDNDRMSVTGPDEDTDAPDQPQDFQKAQRLVEHVPGQRPRQGDYGREVQEILRTAYVYYKADVMAKDAYPDKLTEKTWARSAWTRAADKLGIELSYNTELLAIITQYTWNLRGEIKNAAQSAVRGCYGFKSSVTTAACEANKELTKRLLAGRTFVYETIGNTSDEHVGLYEAEAIQEVIDHVFYKDPEDDGVALDKAYNPFPLQGLALVLSAIQCAIEEWISGTRMNVTFSEMAFKSIYKRHITELWQYEDESGDDRIVTEICAKISENGRLNLSRAHPEPLVHTLNLSRMFRSPLVNPSRGSPAPPTNTSRSGSQTYIGSLMYLAGLLRISQSQTGNSQSQMGDSQRRMGTSQTQSGRLANPVQAPHKPCPGASQTQPSTPQTPCARASQTPRACTSQTPRTHALWTSRLHLTNSMPATLQGLLAHISRSANKHLPERLTNLYWLLRISQSQMGDSQSQMGDSQRRMGASQTQPGRLANPAQAPRKPNPVHAPCRPIYRLPNPIAPLAESPPVALMELTLSYYRIKAKAPAVHEKDELALSQDDISRAVEVYRCRKQEREAAMGARGG